MRSTTISKKVKVVKKSIRNRPSLVDGNTSLAHKIDLSKDKPIKKCARSAQIGFQSNFPRQKYSEKADNGIESPGGVNNQEMRRENPNFGEASQGNQEFVESSPNYPDTSQKSLEIEETIRKMKAFQGVAQETSEIVENNPKPKGFVGIKNKSPGAKDTNLKASDFIELNQEDSKIENKNLNYARKDQTAYETKEEIKKNSFKTCPKTLEIKNKSEKSPEKHSNSLQIRKENSKVPEKPKTPPLLVPNPSIPEKIENIPICESIEVDNNSKLALEESKKVDSKPHEVDEINNYSKPLIAITIKILNCAIDPEKYPETVSPFWIAMEEMKNISPQSKTFKDNVDNLKSKGFIGWKRSRGDGNCYYRAIMNNYIRLIFEVHRNVNFATSFLRLIENIHISIPGFRERQKTFIDIIDYLRRIKAQNPVQAFIEFNKFTQDQEFDKLSFEIGRAIAAQTLIDKKDDPNYQPFIFEEMDFLIGEILKNGEEAGDLGLMMLPLGLNIQIQIFSFFGKDLSLTKYPEEFEMAPNRLPPICVVRRSGHYDILCSNIELDANMYDFKTNCYTFIIENNKKLQKGKMIF